MIEQCKQGQLYVVATPIGNLADMTHRAVTLLQAVDVIAAEDTRHSAPLLAHYGITTQMTALHEHNEVHKAGQLVEQMLSGLDVALISDAGTPLLSDPGYRLVDAAHTAGIDVVPLPGACAAIAGLSASGLPCDHFIFEGFLPAKKSKRQKCLMDLAAEDKTLVLYESVHRIRDCLDDLLEVFGPDRVMTMARELTKTYETIHRGTIQAVRDEVYAHPAKVKGEFVLMVAKAPKQVAAMTPEQHRLLGLLLEELSPSKAAHVVAKFTGQKRESVYAAAMAIKSGK